MIMQAYDEKLIKKVQQTDLEMAKYFVEFCNRNDLLCYFCGGGCIGAVRHKGFIPWDDDLDFFLPRTDYEKMKELWEDTERYALLYPSEDYNDHIMFATIRDKNTTMIKPIQQDIDMVHGVSLDIFPLDGFPKGIIKRSKQVFWALVFQLYCAQLVPENHGGIISLMGRIGLSLIKKTEKRYAVWKYAEAQMSKYKIDDCDSVTEICAGPHYLKNKYPKECFSAAVYMDFENTKMPVPIGYDQYLTIAFGDYMTLPPNEERVPSHDAILIDTDHSYIEYKGRYYCVIRGRLEKNEANE